MKKTLFLILLSIAAFAQQEAEMVSTNSNTTMIDLDSSQTYKAKRNVFTIQITKNNVLQKRHSILNRYKDVEAFDALRAYKRSEKYLYAAPIITAAGFYLGYSAIKGIAKQIEIDGVIYDYKVRSMPKLLTGLTLITTGICFLEYSNDLKKKSIKLYNKKILPQEAQSYIQMGITPSNNFGIYCNL